tara:strand:+ start:3715 stop:3942 length:228 start_codon:yes stop_codon:yes gene_type:complete
MDIIMPRIGETVEEGTIIKWLKKIGDQVSEGEIICEIETSKSIMELPSSIKGILKEIKVNAGETVAVGTLLAVIE